MKSNTYLSENITSNHKYLTY